MPRTTRNQERERAPRKSRRLSSERTPGALFDKLVRLQARLRAPNGCPWDREQTPQSLRTFLVEETYEVLDALDSGSPDEFAGELGDLLLQIIFHALMASEAGQFDIRDVIEHVHDKMVRRHPHVFGDARACNSADVLRNWEQLKAEERKAAGAVKAAADSPPSLLDGIPRSLPAVLEAAKLTRRAAHIGFDWARTEDILDKIHEESDELRSVLAAARSQQHPAKMASVSAAKLENEAGDLLFTAVNVARFLGIDPEIALKKANRKFSRRFRWMELQTARGGTPTNESAHSASSLANVSRDEMERLWDRAKTAESAARALPSIRRQRSRQRK